MLFFFLKRGVSKDVLSFFLFGVFGSRKIHYLYFFLSFFQNTGFLKSRPRGLKVSFSMFKHKVNNLESLAMRVRFSELGPAKFLCISTSFKCTRRPSGRVDALRKSQPGLPPSLPGTSTASGKEVPSFGVKQFFSIYICEWNWALPNFVFVSTHFTVSFSFSFFLALSRGFLTSTD